MAFLLTTAAAAIALSETTRSALPTLPIRTLPRRWAQPPHEADQPRPSPSRGSENRG